MFIRETTGKEETEIIKSFDPDFKYKIRERKGGESIVFCFACGTCTNSCPIREIDEKFNPRKVIKMAILGIKERVFKNRFVWMCSAHYSCQERCPQGVHIGAIASAVREMAEREGYRFEDCMKYSGKDVMISEELDFDFKYKVAEEEGGENIVRCFACGSCTASCPERTRD
ncbi:4Fe-4S dicluster domain-containing protein, partial [Candidatus Aerophobetes bacterium]|nr:4Fe-4S dicluster domain-containing protein [Candidatus Aerophobetes bacterium]